MIDQQNFLSIIDTTPLVSIDLILENNQGKILLGKRTNKPAMGFWFVPGGRIRKNETLDDAMQRISQTELGIRFSINDADLLGAYDHIYDDNFAGAEAINTHYVALAYQLSVSDGVILTADKQHSEMTWWDKKELLTSPAVHQNTKAYFHNK